MSVRRLHRQSLVPMWKSAPAIQRTAWSMWRPTIVQCCHSSNWYTLETFFRQSKSVCSVLAATRERGQVLVRPSAHSIWPNSSQWIRWHWYECCCNATPMRQLQPFERPKTMNRPRCWTGSLSQNCMTNSVWWRISPRTPTTHWYQQHFDSIESSRFAALWQAQNQRQFHSPMICSAMLWSSQLWKKKMNEHNVMMIERATLSTVTLVMWKAIALIYHSNNPVRWNTFHSIVPKLTAEQLNVESLPLPFFLSFNATNWSLLILIIGFSSVLLYINLQITKWWCFFSFTFTRQSVSVTSFGNRLIDCCWPVDVNCVTQ